MTPSPSIATVRAPAPPRPAAGEARRPDLPDAIRRFPFPFPRDAYRYSANVEPAPAWRETAAGGWGASLVDVDDHYREELAERERIIAADPDRCLLLPHMGEAAWDAIELCLSSMARDAPDRFALRREGLRRHWTNAVLGTETSFTLGDDDSLPAPPLRWLGSQVQEDVCLLDQRDGHLWLDAGLLTFAADWSLAFDLGMSFQQFHGPVPRAPVEGIFAQAERFLMRLTPEQAYRRTNWTLTVDGRLDTCTEEYPTWGPDRRAVTAENAGDRVHLRVEVQHLARLPVSGAILFLIRTSMLPLRDVARVPEWARRTRAVLAELPEDMADYKGIARYRAHAVAWLDAHAPPAA